MTDLETTRARPAGAAGNALDDPTGPAPAVVVAVVAHDPGWWFEETLESLAAQDYPNVSVLVVDTASTDGEGLRERVAGVLPKAHLRRLDTNPGYAAAADEILVAVQGASFFLFCHDDVRLAPDAVRVMVEEAYRSNAGVVGPKLVEWTEPRRLLSVGMGSDRYGHPVAYVERGDLDQAQHDSVRDVFYIPGAVTLIRADLFSALGGFDRDMTYHGEDLDLGWRAHAAGARVIVAPGARVGHLEALGQRRPADDRRRLQARHRLRTMRVCDTLATRLRATPIALLLTMVEVVQSLALGRLRQARDAAAAWPWNLRHARSARRRRRQLAAVRQSPDREVRAFQSRGSARLSAYLRTQIGRDDTVGRRRDFVSNLRASRATTTVVAWTFIAVMLVVGSRELLLGSGDIPAVGGFQVLLEPGPMLSRWVSGYQSIGLGSTAPAPTGFGLFGGLGVVFLGAVGVLRKVLILGLWPVGAVGMWRLSKPVGSRRARAVATLAYVIVPLPANAMAEGRWRVLVTYAAMPWLVSQLAAASRLAPFGDLGGSAGPGVRSRPLLHRIVVVGVISALAATLEPAIVVVVAGVAVAVALGGILAGQLAGSVRVLAVGVGGAVVAAVLQLPWSLSAADGWDSVVGVSSTTGYDLGLSDLLRFADGPFGNSLLGWGLVTTAALPLLIGRRWRLGWAVRAWAVAAVGFGVAWLVGQGWLEAAFPEPGVALVPAAVGLALAAGLGMAAFEVDLPDYHFGWRQIVSLLAGAAFVAALFPALGTALSGRWNLPRGDYDSRLRQTFADQGTDGQASRVLWLGDAGSLPLSGWALEAPGVDDLGPHRRLAFATSSGTPTIVEQWAGDDGAAAELRSALEVAADGGTTRLGALLAPMAVRYVVVPFAPAPDPFAQDTTRVPSDLLAVLDGQLDLDSITVNPGVRVYRNAAYGPPRALLASGTEVPAGGDSLRDRVVPALTGAPSVLGDPDGFAQWTGSLDGPGELFLSSQGDRWRLEVDGTAVDRSDALGWASTFAVDRAGPARLGFDTPVSRHLALAGQVVLWVLALGFLLRVRVREEEGATSSGSTVSDGPRHVVIGADLSALLAESDLDQRDRPTMAVPVVTATGTDTDTGTGTGADSGDGRTPPGGRDR